MCHLAFLLLMQYVVSTKAGLVNHVQGPVNVSVTDSVVSDSPVRTEAGGFAEILLNPGSFLRVGENSEVVLDSVDLDALALRIVSGSAVIEAADVSGKQPITVTTGDLTMEIVQSGIYVLGDGKVSIVQGKVRTADSKIEFKKGWQVDKRVAYRAVKLSPKRSSPIETWSEQRSEVMARMNAQIMNAWRPEDSAFGHDNWVFASSLGAYTFVPSRQYVSPYGRRYRSAFLEFPRRPDSASFPDIPNADFPSGNVTGEERSAPQTDFPDIRGDRSGKAPPPVESILP
jgi:hypothetical protein